MANTAVINGVQWIGYYRDTTEPNNPVGPSTNTWAIAFYADNAGAPGARLFDVILPFASVSTTQLGTTSHTNIGVTVNVYRIDALIGAGFQALAGTTYWFSPLSQRTSTFSPFFAWMDGTGGNGTSLQAQLATDGSVVGAPASRSNDRAFTLSNVPEPGTLLLIGPAVIALMTRRKVLPKRKSD